MKLSFAPNEEDDILNTTVENSETGSVMYTIETPKYAGGTLTTTVTRHNQVYRSSRFVFRILWKGTRGSLGDVVVVLDFRTLDEVPVRDILKNAPGGSTYGSVYIDDTEYRWKSKGTGSKVVLVNKDTNNVVAQSHSRIRSSFFKKPRNMSLEISETISHAVDIVLLTFIIVWKERQSERSKNLNNLAPFAATPLSPLPVED